MPYDARTGVRLALALLVLSLTSCSTPPLDDFRNASAAATLAKQGKGTDLIAPSSEPAVDLSPFLDRSIQRGHVPAMGAVVLRGNRVVAQGVAGVRRRGFPEPVTLQDRFAIASCAKAMSAMVIASLVEERKLDWDRPVSRTFPGESVHAAWDIITLRDLLSHTAGLRDPLVAFLSASYLDRGTLSERRLSLAKKILRGKPHAARNDEMVYSNIDYILAATIAEQATGRQWEQMVAERVFAPLGLHSAGFGPPGTPGQIDQPWGHGRHRMLQIGTLGYSAFDPGARSADYPALASPAGYVHLTLQDWAKFVALNLRSHPANPNRNVGVVPLHGSAAMQEVREGARYAAGWFLDTRPWAKGSRPGDTGRVMFHSGDNGRWSSAVWIAPEIDFAVMVVCNRGDQNKAVDDAVALLVNVHARTR
jgi:CubicO group peptidase (beta-lactamase class C family)